MGTGRTDEFRKDAVRIALTSGLTRRQVADDIGVGLSTPNKWVTAHRDTDVVSSEDRELARESAHPSPAIEALTAEPVLDMQAANATKLLGIRRHNNGLVSAGMSGDQQVIRADWRSCGFQFGTNASVFRIGG